MQGVPVLITKSEYFNFLREFWHDSKDSISSARELIKRARDIYKNLPLAEKEIFAETNYISTRLNTDYYGVQLVADFIPYVLCEAKRSSRKNNPRSRSSWKSKAIARSKSSSRTKMGLARRSLPKFKASREKKRRIKAKLTHSGTRTSA